MWAHVGRSNYFSAGNTTTNRVESNWAQLKHVLGKKYSIDQCVRSLWEHTACVLSQCRHCLALFQSCSKAARSYPSILHDVRRKLSAFAFQKVAVEYDHSLADQDCEHRTTSYTDDGNVCRVR